MALKFNKKSKRDSEDDEEDLPKRKKSKKPVRDEDDDIDDVDDTDSDDELDDEEDRPKKKVSKKSKKTSVKEKSKPKSFLKTGSARVAALEAEEQREKAREEAFGKARRFYIHKNNLDEDFMITFVDGELDDKGLLENPVFREHNAKINGRWTQFVSCENDEPDPLQEAGKEPYLAQIFTIIDHTGYKDKEGKQHSNIKRPFVAKKTTMKQLQKIATKRDGLKGCTFSVSRTGPKEPNTGNSFEFEEKNTMKAIAKSLIEDGLSKEDALEAVKPYDYEEVLTYYSADELVKMGLVDKADTISSRKANQDAEDLDSDLDDEDLD